MRKVRVLIDQVFPTDRSLRHRQPDPVVRMDKEKRITIYEVAHAWDPW